MALDLYTAKSPLTIDGRKLSRKIKTKSAASSNFNHSFREQLGNLR